MQISYKTIGALVGVLTIVGFFWTAAQHLASQTDIASVRADMSAMRADMHSQQTVDESRLRDLELGFAKFFGNPATSRFSPTGTAPENSDAHIENAQYQQQQRAPIGQGAPPPVYLPPAPANVPSVAIAPRIAVVTRKFVAIYGIQPCMAAGYFVIGEDGQKYCADDILAIMIRIHTGEIRGIEPRSVR